MQNSFVGCSIPQAIHEPESDEAFLVGFCCCIGWSQALDPVSGIQQIKQIYDSCFCVVFSSCSEYASVPAECPGVETLQPRFRADQMRHWKPLLVFQAATLRF